VQIEAEGASDLPRPTPEIADAAQCATSNTLAPGTKAEVAAHLSQAPTRSEQSTLLSGTMALLLTDIEGSTAQWQESGPAYASALALHHMLLRQQFRRYDGHEIKEMGDGFVVAFARPSEALACAVAGQRALTDQPWPQEVGAIRVRMALHVGEIEVEDDDFRGLALHQASRLLSAAHGGQILCSEAVAALVRHDPELEARLEELGIYRLRDLPAPQRLFQVIGLGQAYQDFGPPKAERANSATLPHVFTRFIGREREVDGLCRLLLPDAKPSTSPPSAVARLVTVMGPGGVGKTRLALEAAHQLVEPLSGAVFFAPLAAVQEAGRLTDALLDALKLSRLPNRDPLDQAVAFLKQQPALLVLDNFEQLLGEEGCSRECVGVVSALLERVASLRVLVTSRQRLGLVGEREYALSPMALPQVGSDQPSTLPERLSDVESVALFVDRAQAARPDFQLTSRNAAAVADLCVGLEGIPLALELAAARSQVLTPSQMLSQLKARFKFLVGRGRGLSDRHRTLEAAVEWSFRLLSPELQRFFSRLCVFRGGWTLEAAEEVCEEPMALDYLSDLRDSSLVVTEEVGETVRFRMLETMREYARSRLTDAEQSALSQRHLQYYLSLAEATSVHRAREIGLHEAEIDNYRAAMRFSRTVVDGKEVGLRLTLAVVGRLMGQRSYSEVREWLNAAMNREGEVSPVLWATALNVAGYAALKQEDGATAVPLLTEAISVATTIEAWDIVHNSMAYRDYFTYGEEMLRRCEEMVAFARQHQNLAWIMVAQASYGFRLAEEGLFESARQQIEAAMTLAPAVRDGWEVPYVKDRHAHIVYWSGDMAGARTLVEENLAVQREFKNREGAAYFLLILGSIEFEQTEDEAAYRHWLEALNTFTELGLSLGVIRSLEAMAQPTWRRHRSAATAASLLSAARNLRGSQPLPMVDRRYYAILPELEASLDAETFQAAQQSGRAFSVEAAASYLMDLLQRGAIL
jgi:predicted ATPase/class 3 adenylate cyclase